MNWGVAMRPFRLRMRCLSIEHRYLPERIVGESWEVRATPRLLIDHADAERVERAWCMLERALHQRVLKMHYVEGVPPPKISRLLGIEQRRDHRPFFEVLGLAQSAIADALDLVDRRVGTHKDLTTAGDSTL